MNDSTTQVSTPNNELQELALGMVSQMVADQPPQQVPPQQVPPQQVPPQQVPPQQVPPQQVPPQQVPPQQVPPQQVPPQQVPPQQVAPDAMADRFSDAPPRQEVQELPEVPQEQQINLPQNTPENVGHAFAASRAEARRYRELAEDFRRQLEAERAQRDDFSRKEAELARQLNEAQKRQGELENQIGQYDLAQTREFRDTYDAPIQNVCDDIAKVLAQNGVLQSEAAARAEDIMLSDDVTDLVANLPSTAQGMIMYKLEEAKGLVAKRQAALDEWRTTQQGLAEVSVRDSAVVSAQHRAEVAEAAFQKVAAIAPTMQWDDPEYAPRRDAAVAKAKAWYQTAPEAQIAAAAMEGFLAPFAYEEIDRLVRQNQELKNQLAGRNRLSSPPVAPYYRSAPVVQPPPPPPPKPGTAEQPWSPADTDPDPLRSATRIVQALAAQ